MNYTLLLPASALLGSLLWLAPAATPASTQGAAPAVAAPARLGSTVVIRYDPAAIYLTHLLVTSLAQREVQVPRESDPSCVCTLDVEHVTGNEMQPKGVFVTLVRLRWNEEVEIPSEEQDNLIERGLGQLRAALDHRIVGTRAAVLDERRAFLKDAVRRHSAEYEVVLSRIAVVRKTERLKDEIQARRADLESSQVEREALQLQLLETIHSTEQIKAGLDLAKAELEGSKEELSRAAALTNKGMLSQAEYRKVEKAIERAQFEVNVAKADLAAREAGAHSLQQTFASREKLIGAESARIEALQAALGAADADTTAAAERAAEEVQLEFRRDLLNADVKELSAELQRVTRERSALADVRIERW